MADRAKAIADGDAGRATFDNQGVTRSVATRRAEARRSPCEQPPILRSSNVGCFSRSRSAVPTFFHGLPVCRANIIKTHQAISRTGLNDLVFPAFRSMTSPFAARPERRLFQAVGPILVGKRAASSGAVTDPSSQTARTSIRCAGSRSPTAEHCWPVRGVNVADPEDVVAGSQEELELFENCGHPGWRRQGRRQSMIDAYSRGTR